MKKILITGVTSGIGFETAVLCNNLGMKVVGTYRGMKPESIEFKDIHLIEMDMDNLNNIEKGFKEASIIFKDKIDVLFCNAGFGLPGAFEDLSSEDLMYQFNTNVFSVHEIAKKFIKLNGHRNASRIIVNSSVLGFTSAPYRGAYVASKFALEGLFGSLRAELKRIESSISIDIIQPGPITTNFKARSLKEYKQWIIPSMVYKKDYLLMERRLRSKENKYAKSANDVAEIVIKLINSEEKNQTKRITMVTNLAWLIKRLLPQNIQEVLTYKTSP
jgi:short-subunit dehydrogenase